MTSTATVENKLSLSKKYLLILDSYKNLNKEELISTLERRGAVERYLYLSIQASIDAAEAFVCLKNYRKPSSMFEAFEILSENSLIEEELLANFRKMVSFRNILSHSYEHFDFAIAKNVLDNHLSDIEKLLDILDRNLP